MWMVEVVLCGLLTDGAQRLGVSKRSVGGTVGMLGMAKERRLDFRCDSRCAEVLHKLIHKVPGG